MSESRGDDWTAYEGQEPSVGPPQRYGEAAPASPPPTFTEHATDPVGPPTVGERLNAVSRWGALVVFLILGFAFKAWAWAWIVFLVPSILWAWNNPREAEARRRNRNRGQG